METVLERQPVMNDQLVELEGEFNNLGHICSVTLDFVDRYYNEESHFIVDERGNFIFTVDAVLKFIVYESDIVGGIVRALRAAADQAEQHFIGDGGRQFAARAIRRACKSTAEAVAAESRAEELHA